jgi:hypothetical protein
LPVPSEFLKHYLSPRINPRQLLEEIEQWAGIPKEEWINLDQNKSDQLKVEILDKLQPVCWQFYTECFQVSKKLISSELTNLPE